MTFEEKLRQLIKTKYSKLSDLAVKFDMNYSQLSQYVNGKKISIDFLTKIIKEFPEADLNWLLRDDDAMVKENPEEYKAILNNEQIIEKIEGLLQELKEKLPS
ncbi:helix-turn-helix domain-containing protein [Seonamhaeicola marinus]|uniref:Helix-turn-helix transcriptional regulator n=1 Tax=Seonamhaeicola marinus TaxID=1912246 RepID=A0A5D0HZB7_9FLAO|nr:helix-turn-helix transcriptional regulator [Seonamhaeicola marinus]TYA74842.1 helix-turn-helix transcriptional regulator [Seonamhaeicola marinus]